MKKAINDGLTLLVVLCPAAFALVLTNFIPPSSDDNMGIGVLGIFGTAVTIAVGFVAEQYAKRTHKEPGIGLTYSALAAALFCLLVLMNFISGDH